MKLPDEAIEAAMTAWYGDERWRAYLQNIEIVKQDMRRVADTLVPYIKQELVKENFCGPVE